MSTPGSLLSVVVIGRNEGERLTLCLKSIYASAYEPDEVIYVDSGSSDASPGKAAACGTTVIVLSSLRPTAAAGRNAGWRQARGKFILFLDGDTILAPDFIGRALSRFDDPTVAIVWGHRRELNPGQSLYTRVLDLDWIYAPGLTPFCGGDALFRRDVLEATGGFDDTLIAGEEPELCRRILARGYSILHIDAPMTTHDLAIARFAQYWRRATRAGHAFAEVSARFAATANPFWLADARRNRTRACILVALALLPFALALVLRSPWPVVFAVCAFAALIVRTAWKARWKSSSALTLLFYGIHSHFQQIPIYVGQLQFLHNRRRGRSAALVEYKQP